MLEVRLFSLLAFLGLSGYANNLVNTSDQVYVHRPSNACIRSFFQAVDIPAQSSRDIQFLTDSTSIFWTTLIGTRKLSVTAISGFGVRGYLAQVNPVVRTSQGGLTWATFRDPLGTWRERRFVITVTNPTRKPVQVVVAAGLTEQSFRVALGEQDCLM